MAMEAAAMACVSGPPGVLSYRRASTEMGLSSVDSFAGCKFEGAAFASWRESLRTSSAGARGIQCSAANGPGKAVYEARKKFYEGPKPISLIGSIGCIGTQTLDIVGESSEAFKVVARAAESDVTVLADQAPAKQKIRIKLRSYWTHLIRQACEQILEAAKNTNAKTMGPVPLPTKRRVYCVLRSPHVDKDSREHFEIRTHHRLIDLMNPNAQTIDALMQLDLPAGVDVEVKLT